MAGRRGAGVETIRVKVSQLGYAEAIQSAVSMGQTLDVWASDAIAHHVYRCEMIQAQEQLRADEKHAIETNGITPKAYEAKYQVTRPKPTITRQPPGGGTGGPTKRAPRP